MVAIAATLATFCCLELAVRVYAYSTGRGFSDHPRAFISPFFTTSEVPAPYKDGDYRVFKEGERVTPHKAEGEVRILCLGGSTTLPAPDSEGYSYVHGLRDLLSDRFPGADIRVLNAGGHSFSSAHSVVNLALRGLEVEPDIVTVYHNINDLSVNYFGDLAVSDYANKYLTPYYLSYLHRSGVLSMFERASRLWRVIVNRVQILQFSYEHYDPTRDFHPGAPFFERNLRSIVSIARAHGADVVLGTQAAHSSLRDGEGFVAYNAIIRRVAAETGTSLAEIARTVVDDAHFVDDVHNTSAGAGAVAQQWVEPVSDLVRRRLDRLQRSSTE
jgi:lysophospholipase L1-like esterase